MFFEDMYFEEEELTREQIKKYHWDVLRDFYNPGAIDRDPRLTERQKEQIHEYNRIYGD